MTEATVQTNANKIQDIQRQIAELQPQTTGKVAVTVSPATPAPSFSLIDGAAGALIISCVVGVVKMASPVVLGGFKSRQDENLKALAENRAAEIALEAATAESMRSMLERSTTSSIAMNQETIDALSGQIKSTVTEVAAKLTDVAVQIDKVSETQKLISDTQVRTLELLEKIEDSFNWHSFGGNSGKPRLMLPERRRR